MKFYTSLILVCLIPLTHLHALWPQRLDQQQEVLVQGASVIVSNQEHEVAMYQTSKDLKHRKANFHFWVINQGDTPFNLYFESLQVTDQLGRPMRVVRQDKLLKTKECEYNTKLFFSTLISGVDSVNANQAGDLSYTQSSYTHTQTRNQAVCSTTTTSGVVHSEGMRQQALREVDTEYRIRNAFIAKNYDNWKEGLENNYFAANTLFPGQQYRTNVQIEIPYKFAKDVTHLFFYFHLGNETHTFCYTL